MHRSIKYLRFEVVNGESSGNNCEEISFFCLCHILLNRFMNNSSEFTAALAVVSINSDTPSNMLGFKNPSLTLNIIFLHQIVVQ